MYNYCCSPDLLALPNGGEKYNSFTPARIVWGAGFTGTVKLEYTTNNGGSWSSIEASLPADQRVYDWTIPNLDTTYQAKVRVTNNSNPSQTDASDSVFTINKNLTMGGMSLLAPPSFTKIFVSAQDTSSVTFSWRKAGFHQSIRYKWLIRKIGGSSDLSFTSNNSGADTAFTVKKHILDSLARNVFGLTNDTTACIWKVRAYNGYDSTTTPNFIVTFADPSVGITPISGTVPEVFKLNNNYPNPFNPATKITFEIPEQSHVKLTVFDITGKEIATLINDDVSQGNYSMVFNTGDISLSSGIYFYRLEANYKSGSFVETKQMVLLK